MEILEQSVLDGQSSSTKKSYERVKASYNKFRGESAHSEDVVCKWLVEQAKTKKASTLTTEISLLFKYLEVECRLQLPKDTIYRFLKHTQSTQTKKQSPAFTPEDIFKYLLMTPNEPPYLTTKLYVLFSYFGALRTCRQ
jgi:hypothetical protein